MPTGYLESNESNYLASNLAIQSTSLRIQSFEETYLDSNIAIQSTLANIILLENTYLDSNFGIQSTPVIYPQMFTVSGTEIQTWVG